MSQGFVLTLNGQYRLQLPALDSEDHPLVAGESSNYPASKRGSMDGDSLLSDLRDTIRYCVVL